MPLNDTCTLTTLLPSTPYLLAYSLPLLFLSILLTFSGAFLTLDRTRSFPPRYDAIPGAFDQPQKHKFNWLLEGGIGGLAAGYAFGVHFSTFLALLIPATSSSTPLSSKSFLAVWLLSSVVTTFLAGRWRYCALTFFGISSGGLFALSLSVIIHPSLLARIILPAIFIPVLTLFTVLPLARFKHVALRFASASTGAFGIVLAIALLSHVLAWANVWERLWVSSSLKWGTGKEKGLSTAFCLFLCAGAACDWMLKREFGECPDQKWDEYLATYATNLPNRAGTFRPLASAWDRLLGSSPHKPPVLSKDIVFPTDDELKLAPPPSNSPFKLREHGRDGARSYSDSGKPFQFKRSPEFLKRGKSQGRLHAGLGRKPREVVKFRPLGNISSESEDETEDDHKRLGHLGDGGNVRPWLKQKASLSSTSVTLVDDNSDWKGAADEINPQKEMEKLGKKGLGEREAPEYSDLEDDMTSGSIQKGISGDSGDNERRWSPGFLKRHQLVNGQVKGSERVSPTVSQRAAVGPVTLTTGGSPPVGAVPATPSLIKALDRIAVAQRDVFGEVASVENSEGQGKNGEVYKGQKWEEFWKEVRERAKT